MALKPAILFQDHMVLQRDKEVPIWGTAAPGAAVTVRMQGQEAQTRADENGGWLLRIGPLRLSYGEELEICAGKERIVIRDVAVGEVWLAGGQSNMEFHMRYDADMAQERLRCENPLIRFFDYPEVSHAGQIDEADYRSNYGFWRLCAPEQLERFSAVGYYFAKELQEKYGVPVGVIGCNWGGTPACAWMSREAVLEGGGQVHLDEYDTAVRKLDLAAYEEGFQRNRAAWRTDLLANPVEDMMMFGRSRAEMDAKLVQMGIDPASLIQEVGPKDEHRPCGLYDAMLRPIAPYGIRGVIWYQGETDGDHHPEAYETLFPALIRCWRALWGEELPFLFVQLAPLRQWMDCVGTSFITIREVQQHTVDSVPGTGMAVITDVGMEHDIHPKKKQPVGHRLALLAMAKVYGEDLLCEAPSLSRVEVEEGKITLTFDHAGEGLYLTDTAPYGQRLDGERLGGLQIFQDGVELDGASLKARAQGDQVVVSGGAIRAGAETQVMLAQTGWYLVNLYNSADIPARPAVWPDEAQQD